MIVTLPPAASISTYVVFYRLDETTNSVIIQAPNATDKIDLRNATRDIGGGTYVDFKNIITDRPFYVAKEDDDTYNFVYINNLTYPYDRNNNAKPEFAV